MRNDSALVATALLRSGARRRFRLVAAVVSGAMCVMLTVGVTFTLLSILTSIKESSGYTLIPSDLLVAARSTGGFQPDVSSRISSAAPSGSRITGATFASTRLDANDQAPLTLVAIAGNRSSNFTGFEKVDAPHGDGIVLSESFATRHGLKLGDRFNVTGPKGKLAWRVTGIAGGRVQNNGSIALVGSDALQARFERAGTDVLFFEFPPGGSVAEHRSALQRAAGPSAIVGSANDVVSHEQSSFAFVRQILMMTTAVGVLAAGVVQFVCWKLLLEDERDVIARLRLVGYPRRSIVQGSAVLVGALGLLALAVGLPMGLLAGFGMQMFAKQVVSLSGLAAAPRVPSPIVPFVVGTAVGVAMISGAWLSVVRGFLRISPIEAVRGTAPSAIGRRTWAKSAMVGVGLCAVATAVAAFAPAKAAGAGLLLAVLSAVSLSAAVVVLVGRFIERRADMSSLLAGRSLSSRSTRSTSITAVLAVALTLGLAMTGLSYTLGRGLDSSVTAWANGDFFVMPAKPGVALRDERFPAGTGAQLEKVPGVESVIPFTLAPLKYKGKNVQLYAWGGPLVEEKVHLDVASGLSEKALWDSLRSGDIAVSENFATVHHLAVGDRIALPAATDSMNPRIRAIVRDYTADTGIIFASTSTYTALSGDSRELDLIVNVKEGADHAAVKAAIRTQLGTYSGLTVWTGKEMRAYLLGLMGQVLSILQAIGVIGLVLAALVTVTIIVSAVPIRLPSVGLARLVGMAESNVRRQLRLEAAGIAISSWIAAVPAGIVAVHAAVLALGSQNGSYPPVHIWWPVLAVILFEAVVATYFSMMVPSRRLLRPSIASVTRDE